MISRGDPASGPWLALLSPSAAPSLPVSGPIAHLPGFGPGWGALRAAPLLPEGTLRRLGEAPGLRELAGVLAHLVLISGPLSPPLARVLAGAPPSGPLRLAWPQPSLGPQPASPDNQGYLKRPALREARPGRAPPFQRAWGVGAVDLPDAPSSWGAGGRLVVVERSWHHETEGSIQPEDLPPRPILFGSPSAAAGERDHGTADLGILDMRRGNGLLGWGLCPEAEIGLVAAPAPASGAEPLPLYVALAELLLRAPPGTVVLVEEQLQVRLPSDGQVVAVCPWLDPLVRRLVLALLERGVSVVLPAGNGYVDLDEIGASVRPPWSDIFRARRDRPSTTPIIVGAVSPSTQGRSAYSNHGSEVGLCAWGSDVYTLSVQAAPELDYQLATRARFDFGGTSAAAAIVAGAATVVQAMARDLRGGFLRPAELLAALRHEGTTTDSPLDRVGVMPDLPAIRKRLALGPLS